MSMPKHDDQDVPLVGMSAYDLVDLLNRDYPHRCMLRYEQDWEHHRYAGARELVDYLIEIVKRELEADAAAREG